MKRSEFRKKIGGKYVTAFNKNRLMWGFALIVLVFAVLIFRVAYWQVIKGDEISKKASSMQKIDSAISPTRGTIYDRNKKPLAETVMSYKLYGYTNNLYKSVELKEADKKRNLKDLSKLTGVTEKKMKKLLTGRENLTLLAENLSQSQVDKLEKRFTTQIVVKTEPRRVYPNKEFASQTIGNVDANFVGRAGIEYQYNQELSGLKGRTIRTADSQGNVLAAGGTKNYKVKDGYNVVTTIDEVIQNYVEEAIARGMERTGAESITCIVMDPRNGDVLAMAHTPGYDPNKPYEPLGENAKKEFKKLSLKKQNEYLTGMWTNPAVSHDYEPGSTFKLIIAASALDCGKATDKSRYYCNGTIDVDGTVLHCWAPGHGEQNLKEAVGNSCNPAMARVALDMGTEKMYRYISLFGLMDKTNIDVPGETNSIIKKKNGLSNVDIATTGYGHGVAITPIQLITAVNALGNDGWLMQPKIVKKIEDKNGKTVSEVADKKVRQVISKHTADKMRDIMEYYISDAGGTIAYIPGYRMGGKTGTAYIAENGKYTDDTVTSFIGMAPMDDPQLTVLVLVNRSKRTYFGASSAGPILKEIMEKSLEYKGVERRYTDKEKAALKGKQVEVPDVTGINSNAAIAKIRNKGLKCVVSPENGDNTKFNVIDQYPKAGTSVPKGSTVYLYKE